MKKTLATALSTPLITALALLAVPAAASVPAGWHDEVSAAHQEALDSGNLILVDLYAEWCGWCRRLESEVFEHPEFASYAKKFVKLKVDVEDGAEGSALQARFDASSLPTTLLLTPKMVLVDMVQGYLPRQAFMQRLETGISEFQQEQTTFAKILAGGDTNAKLSVARALHGRGDGSAAATVYQGLLRGSELESQQRTRLLYMLADAQRIDGDFDAAVASLQKSRESAQSAGDSSHIEACDLLRIRIAEDRGLCSATIAALKTFLDNHPTSGYSREAKRSLARLNRTECT